MLTNLASGSTAVYAWPVTADDNAIRQKLDAMRADLEAMTADGTDAAAPVVLDQSNVGRLSRMDAMQSQAIARESQARRAARLVQIEAALKRLEDGVYGECVECAEPISPARLHFDPAAALCIGCAARAEEEQ